MVWVHFHISHGPGHQSSNEKYIYFKKATEEAIKFYMEECLDLSRMEWPIVRWKRVRSLPESEYRDLVSSNIGKIKAGREMLEILKETKTHKEFEYRCNKCSDWSALSKSFFKKHGWGCRMPNCSGKYMKKAIEVTIPEIPKNI